VLPSLLSHGTSVLFASQVRQGNALKTLSIPGVSEMLIEFDPQSFQRMGSNSSVRVDLSCYSELSY